MLRTVGDQPTLWESILPANLLTMSEERKAAQVGRLRRTHPEHQVAAPAEEQGDRQSRRPGGLDDHFEVPAGVPASAAASTSARLSTVGQHLRLATVSPISSKIRTVCALAMPRSMPSRRRWFLSSPSVVSAVGDAQPKVSFRDAKAPARSARPDAA